MSERSRLGDATSSGPQGPPAELLPAPRRRVSSRSIAILTGVLLLVFWEVVGRQISPLFASYPTGVVSEFLDMNERGVLMPNVVASVRPFAIGYALSIVIGIPLGLALGRFRIVEAALGVYVVAAYQVPLIALMPLFVLWFGLGVTVKVAIIVTLAVFPIILNTWDGVRAVPKSLLEVGYAFTAPQHAVMLKIVLPATLPYIVSGLRLAVGRGIIGVVVAEFFTAIDGLGGLIIRAGGEFNTAAMFVPVILLMLMGVLLTQLVAWVERRIAPWQTDTRAQQA